MQSTVVAVISEDSQNDIVAALHAAGVGHLTRVLRKERGPIADQLRRAGVDTAGLPSGFDEAERVVLVIPAPRALETACLVLQRGASNAWMLTEDEGWQIVDDTAIEIAATPELPARPVAPPHRSARTFRKQNIRRRPRRGVITPATPTSGDGTRSE